MEYGEASFKQVRTGFQKIYSFLRRKRPQVQFCGFLQPFDSIISILPAKKLSGIKKINLLLIDIQIPLTWRLLKLLNLAST